VTHAFCQQLLSFIYEMLRTFWVFFFSAGTAASVMENTQGTFSSYSATNSTFSICAMALSRESKMVSYRSVIIAQ